MTEGTPVLRGSARLSFPLQTFCQAADTGSRTSRFPPRPPAWRSATGNVVLPAQAAGAGARFQVQRAGAGAAAPAGFSGNFPLPKATLLPAGLLSYHLNLSGGTAAVAEGVLDPAATRVSGSLLWGPGLVLRSGLPERPGGPGQGLFLTQGTLKGEVPVGAYGVQSSQAGAVWTSPPAASPPGIPPGLEGGLPARVPPGPARGHLPLRSPPGTG